MCPSQGQGETKHCPALRAVLRPDLTPVALDDRARDRQPKPGALLLRGIKCLENIAQLIAWNTRAGIRNRDLDSGFPDLCRLKHHPALARHALEHRVQPFHARFNTTCWRCIGSASTLNARCGWLTLTATPISAACGERISCTLRITSLRSTS